MVRERLMPVREHDWWSHPRVAELGGNFLRWSRGEGESSGDQPEEEMGLEHWKTKPKATTQLRLIVLYEDIWRTQRLGTVHKQEGQSQGATRNKFWRHCVLSCILFMCDLEAYWARKHLWKAREPDSKDGNVWFWRFALERSCVLAFCKTEI